MDIAAGTDDEAVAVAPAACLQALIGPIAGESLLPGHIEYAAVAAVCWYRALSVGLVGLRSWDT